MRVFVVAGSPVARQPVGFAPENGDLVIAADLGARHAASWGWPIHLLVGDLDSLTPREVRKIEQTGAPILRVPAAKNQTDTELAIWHALQRGVDRLIICGAMGGRTDHLLANILLLAHASLANVDVCLVDGLETVRLLSAYTTSAGLEIDGAPGDLLSLLPLGESANGVTTTGLLYPLYSETLHLGEARGVSNVFAAPHAGVSLGRGRLLVIHNRIGMP
jgi:thiamine pyrophosphokinase